MSSQYTRAAARQSAAVALAAVLALFLPPLLAPHWSIADLPACAAAAYVLGLFCFQSMFGMEWVVFDRPVAPLLVAAALTMLFPSVLAAYGCWFGIWRSVSLIADATLILTAYRVLIRGAPLELPPPGSLKGRVCIITGCNTGIGYHTAEALARCGATVVFACRSEARARAAIERLLTSSQDAGVTKEQLRFFLLDVASIASVRRFAESIQSAELKVHTLILNAGVMLTGRNVSEDGFEMTMASNHLGHFLLARLLLPNLLASEAGGEAPRIVLVGSNLCYLHDAFDFSEVVAVKSDAERESFLRRPYSIWRAYGQSKLANLLFTAELDRRLRKQGSRISVNCVHPGEVLTDVMRDMHPAILWLYSVFQPMCFLFFKTAPQGAACTLFAATAPQLATSENGGSGLYLNRFAPAPKGKVVEDEVIAKRLWELSEQLTGPAPEI